MENFQQIAYRKIYLFQRTFYVAGIKISYYRNARACICMYVCMYTYIREVETTWCIYSEMIRI